MISSVILFKWSMIIYKVVYVNRDESSNPSVEMNYERVTRADTPDPVEPDSNQKLTT